MFLEFVNKVAQGGNSHCRCNIGNIIFGVTQHLGGVLHFFNAQILNDGIAGASTEAIDQSGLCQRKFFVNLAYFQRHIEIYLAVWNLKGEKEVVVRIAESITDAQIAYPAKTSVKLHLCQDGIQLTCPDTPCAVFLEIKI